MTVFIQKGDKPLTAVQATQRGVRLFESQLAQWQREMGILLQDPAYVAWAQQWVADNVINEENNQFNVQLYTYNGAVERLAQYRVADGRPVIMGEEPTDGNSRV